LTNATNGTAKVLITKTRLRPAEPTIIERPAPADRPKARGEPKLRSWPSPAEIAMRIASTVPRFVTGIASLDAACRGGIPVDKSVVIQGPPGSGKTGVAMQLARLFIRVGGHVTIYAGDEEDTGWMVRWGQHEGYSRDDLEDRTKTAARVKLAKSLADVPLLVVDADVSGATVEDICEESERRRGDRPSMIIVDDLQNARTRTTDLAEGPRATVDNAVRVLKSERKRRGHFVVAISEVNRTLYGTRRGPRPNALAGAKESSAIEYGTHLLLSLSNVEGTDLFDVQIPKNRIGQKTAFRLAQDRARCWFVEVPIDPRVYSGTAERRAEQHERIVRAVKHSDKLANATQIALAAGGQKAFALALAKEMIEAGELTLVDGFFRLRMEVKA